MVRAFDIAHVIATALAVALPGVAILNDASDVESLGLVGLYALGGAVGAAIACLVCRWWPGLAASGWKLWLGAWLFNPVVLVGLAIIVYQYQCLFGQTRGWHCMAMALVVLASPVTLIGPTIAVIVHVIARSGRETTPKAG